MKNPVVPKLEVDHSTKKLIMIICPWKSPSQLLVASFAMCSMQWSLSGNTSELRDVEARKVYREASSAKREGWIECFKACGDQKDMRKAEVGDGDGRTYTAHDSLQYLQMWLHARRIMQITRTAVCFRLLVLTTLLRIMFKLT